MIKHQILDCCFEFKIRNLIVRWELMLNYVNNGKYDIYSDNDDAMVIILTNDDLHHHNTNNGNDYINCVNA